MIFSWVLRVRWGIRTWAMGCPNSLLSVAVISGFIHEEMTIRTRNPRSQEAPIALIIPRGTALAALCA